MQLWESLSNALALHQPLFALYMSLLDRFIQIQMKGASLNSSSTGKFVTMEPLLEGLWGFSLCFTKCSVIPFPKPTCNH